MESFKLDAKNLSINVGTFGSVNILDNVSLSFRSGELVGVLGPSGSGKSTLIKALCGFHKAGKGSVTINGDDLYRNMDKYRTSVGYVPQDDIIHKELSVYKTLKYAALLRLGPEISKKEIELKISYLLKELELSERKTTIIKKLSGGQRKRVSIAVELLTSPGLILLDEPTSGLDPALEHKMMELLKKLASENRLILVSTHIMKSLRFLDLIVVMIKGKLAFAGPPDEIKTYFSVEDITDIFHELSRFSATDWQKRYISSPLFTRYVASRLNEAPPVSSFGAKLSSGLKANLRAPVKSEKADISLESMEAELERLKKELG